MLYNASMHSGLNSGPELRHASFAKWKLSLVDYKKLATFDQTEGYHYSTTIYHLIDVHTRFFLFIMLICRERDLI